MHSKQTVREPGSEPLRDHRRAITVLYAVRGRSVDDLEPGAIRQAVAVSL